MKSDLDSHVSRPWFESSLALDSTVRVSAALVSALGPVLAMGLIAGAALSLCTAALAQDAAAVAAGENAWDKAGCLQCHGASGQGGDGGEFPAGPSLQKTRLDRAALAETISCGLPGTQMPSWLDGAYTKRSCYGFPIGPAPAEVTVTPVLSAGEIEALVDYLKAKIVGH
jgi:mono/diheme cytochrome c family protein